MTKHSRVADPDQRKYDMPMYKDEWELITMGLRHYIVSDEPGDAEYAAILITVIEAMLRTQDRDHN